MKPACISAILAATLLTDAVFGADPRAMVIDDFTSGKSTDWSLSGLGAKGMVIETNAVAGLPALRATISVPPTGTLHAGFLTKKVKNLPGIWRWERLTFRFKLSNTQGIAAEKSLVCRLRTGPAQFTDLPFAEPQKVRPGTWQEAVVRLDSPANPRNIYTAYFHPIQEFTFRLGVAEGCPLKTEFSVADIRLWPKPAADEAYEPRITPCKNGGLRKALVITHAAASFYFVRETLEALSVTVERRFFRGLHFPIFGFPATARELREYDLVALVDVDPYVLTRSEIERLCDYAASGGGLLFIGGANTLGAARFFPRVLAEMLPATFEEGRPPIVTKRIPEFGEAHPITDGVLPGSRRIALAHRLTPKAGATVVARAGEKSPLLLTRDFHRGRIVLLNGAPNVAEDANVDYFTSGEYRTLLARTCQWLANQQPAAKGLAGYTPNHADFPAAQPLDRTGFFPIASWLPTGDGGHLLDERALREHVDDLWEHGFNTVAIGGLRNLARTPSSNRERLLDYAARYAQSRGMAVMFEYTHLTDLKSDGPLRVCVFAPNYKDELAKQVRPQLDAAKRYLRGLSVKILDEPTAGDSTPDYCELCKREFQTRYNRPLRKRTDIPTDDREGHRQLTEFVSHYVARGYDAIRQIARESSATAGLLLTYMCPGFGYADTRRGVEDPFAWSHAADFVDFDVYPYFYPVSQNVRMLQAHWCFGVQRVITEHLGKPAGFYVELDDRNYPFQINPVEASSECAWTAVSQGCRYLNSFIHVLCRTGSGARPERWDHLGRELRKIREAGPLLARARKAPSPLALYFPHAQWMSGGRKFAPAYSYQLLLRAFGECDIAHEQVAAERGGFGPVKMLALVETDFLPPAAVARLVSFVRGGGALLCDDTTTLPAELRDNPAVIRFAGSLEQQFQDAVETPNAKACADLLRRVREATAKAGLTSHARADNDNVETNLLTSEGIELLVAVNHAPRPVTTTVRLAGRSTPLRLRLEARNGTLVVTHPGDNKKP